MDFLVKTKKYIIIVYSLSVSSAEPRWLYYSGINTTHHPQNLPSAQWPTIFSKKNPETFREISLTALE